MREACSGADHRNNDPKRLEGAPKEPAMYPVSYDLARVWHVDRTRTLRRYARSRSAADIPTEPDGRRLSSRLWRRRSH